MLSLNLTRRITQALTRKATEPGNGGAASFDPASLFTSGEQGVWYDPSDFSTMFQDSAGTVPVTAVGQSVGLILDKSGRGNHASQVNAASRPVLSARKNLVTSSEDFSNAAWTKSNVTVTPGQAANATGSMTLCKVEATTTAGAIVYQACTSAGGSNGNTLRVLARKGSGPTDCNEFGLYNITTGTLLSKFTINYDTGAVAHSFGSGATAISLGGGLWEIKQTLVAGISGNDTLQVYAGFMGDPEAAGEFAYIGEYQLERVPSARENLVTSSEDFSNAAWTKSNVTVTPGQAANATGSMTLCKVEATTTAAANVYQACTSAGGSNGNTLRVLARKGSGPTDCNEFGLYNNTTATLLSKFTINYDTGAVAHSFGSGATAISLGGGLWEIRQTLVAGISGNDKLSVYAGFMGDPEAAGEFAYIGEYQLERVPSAATYQRVNTATDYDTVGFPHYLKFDGVDDKLTTTFPNLGSNVTIARSVPGVDASILTGQTIGAGAWDDSTNHCGLVIVNRALTGPETAILTTYLNELAGV